MSKRVLTLDPSTGKKKLVTILGNAEMSEAVKAEQTYNAETIDTKVDTIGNAIDQVKQSILNAKGVASYQDAVLEKVAAQIDIVTPVEGGRYLIGNDIAVYTEGAFQITAAKAGMSLVILSDGNEYEFDGTEWKDKIADDARIVHTSGDETIGGNKTFSDNVQVQKGLVVDGDLTVKGTTTTVSSENLVVKDNVITLNDQDLGKVDGSGITLGTAGFEVNRGTVDGTAIGAALEKAKFVFDDSQDLWKAGLEGVEKVVARIDDENNVSQSETYSAAKIEDLFDKSNYIDIAKDATTAFAAGEVVFVDPVTGKAVKADCTNLDCMNKLVGVVVNPAALEDTTVKVIKYGTLPMVGATAGSVYFLGATGELTVTVPSTEGQFINKVGEAVADGVLLVNIAEGIEIGA